MTSPTASDSSLYTRLGGYDAICAATDDLLRRLQADPQLRDYWKGTSEATRRKGRQLVVDFMVEAAGGPAFYAGHDMRAAHAGMHIGERDWEVFMRHASATLEHFTVPTPEREEVLGFFAGLKDEVVEGP
jgi:hemoglobin